MTPDALVKQLADSRDLAATQLVADFRAGDVQPLWPGPGTESASSLRATFAIREKTAAAAGVRSLGLGATIERLAALPAEDQIVLYHFSGDVRIFSVFVRKVDEQVVGVVMVDRMAPQETL